MAIKSISQIIIKKGSINYLPDSLSEGEMCFTTDTGEVFIGAPNFGPVQYRTSQTGGENKLPYRNIKLLTEFDAVKSITGDIYFQGPLLNVQFPITETAVDLYTFTEGNTIIVSYSLYDGVNVNVVGDLYISVNSNNVMVCKTGQKAKGIIFSGYLNSNGQVVLQGINTTDSIYTLYINAKCWDSELAKWDGTKGSGINSSCAGDGTLDDNYLRELQDVKLTNLSDKQFLQYNSTDKLWENTTINYSDISGDIPSGKQYISTLLDVKLTNLSDNQYLKYNSTDKMWENVAINYSDITGTPPVTTPSIATCSDVSLKNLTGSQILQYSSTDQKWENVAMPPAQAAWTVSSVAASGSTITDATKCTTTLINVSSSDGYSQGVSTATLSPMIDPTAPAAQATSRYYFRLLGHGGYDYVNSLANSNAQNRYMDSITLTGNGSGCVLETSPITSYIIDSFTIGIGSSDITSQNIAVNDTYTLISTDGQSSFPQLQMIITNISNGSVTFKTQYNSYNGDSYKDQTTQDLQNLNNLSNNSLIYLTNDNLYGLMFSGTNTLALMTLLPLSNRSAKSIDLASYSYAGSDGNVLMKNSYWWVLRNPAFSNYVTSSVYIPGENYSVGDTASVDNGLLTMKVTAVTSVPTRGIVMPDPQPTGSMVIVKNNTNNKPINVYSTTVSGNGNLLANIPDSTYKNYETKFIKTTNGWVKF
ncbi:MAG: hypothetical protein [Caudoviricetes sp.]|nr:MAG: hypothetical protein [Caudoviricetes sp.]